MEYSQTICAKVFYELGIIFVHSFILFILLVKFSVVFRAFPIFYYALYKICRKLGKLKKLQKIIFYCQRKQRIKIKLKNQWKINEFFFNGCLLGFLLWYWYRGLNGKFWQVFVADIVDLNVLLREGFIDILFLTFCV